MVIYLSYYPAFNLAIYGNSPIKLVDSRIQKIINSGDKTTLGLINFQWLAVRSEFSANDFYPRICCIIFDICNRATPANRFAHVLIKILAGCLDADILVSNILPDLQWNVAGATSQQDKATN